MKNPVLLAVALAFILGAAGARYAAPPEPVEKLLIGREGQKAVGRLTANEGGVIFELLENGDRKASRAGMSLDDQGRSSLTLCDQQGNVRFRVLTDADGATSLGIANQAGQIVWGVDVDSHGRVKFKSQVATVPTEVR